MEEELEPVAEDASKDKLGGLEYKFPEVLLRSPRCLIALSGLDVTNNAIHRLVWEEFSSGRRVDRKPILFKNFPADHLYPKFGTNRTTYEDYALQGILKISWLKKHCEELPALVAFFFDLDWNDPQWDEKQTECVSKIEVIRSALQNRATEIVIVLLQSTPPLPVGEASNINSERAAGLCAACELPRLNLFVLPFTHRPQGFISKIEEAFYKKAVLYYSNKIHTTRAHKDLILNKQSLQLLFIRHNFKMAFFAEMKQEPGTALKLYRAAYAHLLENMYLSDDRIMEFKMIAGFINYKICRLCFESDEPIDAISQFRKHIDRFSVEPGMKQLAYEQYEWLSRQFSAFAELFSETLRRGLKGLQTQNPGLYYHQAALHAIQRKIIANQLVIDPNNAQLLPSLPQVCYYGQRPWRKSLTDDKPSNMELRQRCILTMQSQEKDIEHSWQIIPLLTQAVSHMKSYGCERMITSLKVFLADEYSLVKDYEKSFVLLNGVMELYRSEQWWDNLNAVLLRVLRYSYLLGFLQEYVTVGLELIGRYLPIETEEKKRVQNNLAEIFAGQTPYPEVGLCTDDVQRANVKWAEVFQNIPSNGFTIQLSSLAGCVECKTVFKKQSFMADEVVDIQVFLRSSAPLNLCMSRIVVHFLNEEYNSMCVQEEEFVLEPNVVKAFNFSFPPLSSSVGNTIEVHAVEASLKCTGVMVSPTLVWSNGTSECFASQPSDLVWQKIKLQNKASIVSRSSHISVFLDHSNPALVGEYYDAMLVVVNQEKNTAITGLDIRLSLPESLNETQPHVAIYDCPPDPNSPSQGQSLELTCPRLEANGDNFTKKLYFCSQGTGTRKINITVVYQVACNIREEWDPVICLCQKHHCEVIEIVKPFELVYKLMSTKFKHIESISYGSPFILMTELSCTSPWKLFVVESNFEPNKDIQVVGEDASQVEGCELSPKDSAVDCYCLLPMNNPQTTASMGTYTVKWRRAANAHSQILTSTVSFPPVAAKYQAYTMSADIPAYGQVMSVLPVSYSVHNKSALVQEFEAKMGASDAFMYSGNRIIKFRILPSSTHTITYNLLPIITGFVSLPHVDLVCQRETEKGVTPVVNNELPTSILIKPSPISTMLDLDLSLT